MSEQTKHKEGFVKFVIRDETRKRCKIIPVTPEVRKRFRPLSLELFPYFKEVPAIDFAIYFRASDEMIEFIKPAEFSKELIDQLLQAAIKPLVDVDVCILLKDYPKYELLLTQVREKKIKALMLDEPALDQVTLQVFSDLSTASQMIVQGGVNTTVAKKATDSIAHLMHTQLSSDVVIGTLSRMIQCDATLYDHSASVAMFAGIIAGQYTRKKLPIKEQELIALGGLYHDVGKTCVPSSILNKPGAFSPDEYEIMKQHTTLGHEELLLAIEKGAPVDKLVAQVALEHHERFDGRGYPQGKRGRLEEQPLGIHLYARIVAIADVYSAMLMKRVYKEAIVPEKAIAIMKDLSERDYDREIFTPFYDSVLSSLKSYDKKKDELIKSRIIMIGEKDSFSDAIKHRGGK